jgi:hypothetical protein
MMNNEYNYLKTKIKIHRFLMEMAEKWKTLTGHYPSHDEFNLGLNHLLGYSVLSESVSTQEISETDIRNIAHEITVFALNEGGTVETIKAIGKAGLKKLTPYALSLWMGLLPAVEKAGAEVGEQGVKTVLTTGAKEAAKETMEIAGSAAAKGAAKEAAKETMEIAGSAAAKGAAKEAAKEVVDVAGSAAAKGAKEVVDVAGSAAAKGAKEVVDVGTKQIAKKTTAETIKKAATETVGKVKAPDITPTKATDVIPNPRIIPTPSPSGSGSGSGGGDGGGGKSEPRGRRRDGISRTTIIQQAQQSPDIMGDLSKDEQEFAPTEVLHSVSKIPHFDTFTRRWYTQPTSMNEGKLSPKESLQRKLNKQRYKVSYIQDGKKVEVFASSLRGVRRVVYGKKQYRVQNSTGSDVTGYFKKLLGE